MSTFQPQKDAVTVSAETVVRMWSTGSQVSIKDTDGRRWDVLDARGFGPNAVRFELYEYQPKKDRRWELTLDVHPDKRLDALFY